MVKKVLMNIVYFLLPVFWFGSVAFYKTMQIYADKFIGLPPYTILYILGCIFVAMLTFFTFNMVQKADCIVVKISSIVWVAVSLLLLVMFLVYFNGFSFFGAALTRYFLAVPNPFILPSVCVGFYSSVLLFSKKRST